jgi:predicted lysophospholipase L1 biosynthesis ABC-type transport system permease subunit
MTPRPRLPAAAGESRAGRERGPVLVARLLAEFLARRGDRRDPDRAAGRRRARLAGRRAADRLRVRPDLAAAVAGAAQMGSQPLALALALGLAAAAVLSLALTVLASVRRRRRELALLKTLGMTRRQVRAVIAWQTTLTLLIAVAFGLPLGIAAGRLAWQAFAGSLGITPVTVVPALVLAAGAVVLVLAGNLLASGPAAVAAQTDPAVALRAE